MSTPSKKKRKQRSEFLDYQSSKDTTSSNADTWNGSPSTVTLQPGQVVYFEGEAHICVQRGAIWLNGTFLEAGGADVHICADAALGGALPIEAIASGTQVPHPHQDVQVRFSSAHDSRQTCASSRADGDSAERRGWRLLAQGMPPAHRAPQDWREAAARISAAVQEACASGGSSGGRCVAVCGAKGTGKSSFARLLANSLLSWAPAVAWLDTDCGQPEFTVPGMVSVTYLDRPVYGLPHMHQRRPVQARFVGHLSAERDPVAYGGAVEELLTWHRQHRPSVPLIINTCGWIKGLGQDLLADVLHSAAPSHVVLLQTANPRRNLPAEPFWAAAGAGSSTQVLAPACSILQLLAVGQPHALPAAPALQPTAGQPAPKKLTAAESRSLAWLVWAREILRLPTSGIRWETDALGAAARGLAAQTPYVVRLKDISVEVLHARVAPAQLGYVLNGALVGLCSRPECTADGQAGRPSAACLGVGMVRAVDMAQGCAFVLTPLDQESLQQVNVLQVGRLELPPELLQSGAVVSPYLSTWSIATAGTGAGAIKSRNNLLRAAQIAA